MAVQDLLNTDFSDMTGQEVLAFIKNVEATIRKLTKEDAEANKEAIKALKTKRNIAKEIFNIENETKDLAMEIMTLEGKSAEYIKSGAEASKQLVDDFNFLTYGRRS